MVNCEKDGVVKGGIFDAQTGNPWCHKDCSRFHPTEVQKMVRDHKLHVYSLDQSILWLSL